MDEGLRVLHVIDSLRLGGAQTFLRSLLPELRRLGVECDVAALWGPQALSRSFAEAGFPARELVGFRGDPRLPARLRRVIRRGEYDLVHAHLIPSTFLCETLREWLGIRRLIAHVHATPGRAVGYQRVLERMCYRRADRVIACSRATAALLPPGAPVEVVHNGIDTERFRPLTVEERRHVRAQWGIGPEDLVIGTAGRLAPEKNQGLILEAAARLVDSQPSIHIVVAGSGASDLSLREQTRQLQLEKRTRFLGDVENLPAVLGAMDVFVMPSMHEGFGLSLVEAMACGITCVATPFPTATEIGGSDTIVVSQSTPSELASILGRLLDDPDARHVLGKRGRERTLGAFRIGEAAALLTRIYGQSRGC